MMNCEMAEGRWKPLRSCSAQHSSGATVCQFFRSVRLALSLPFRNCSSVITFAAAAVDSLSLPFASSAQGWGRNRTCARALMIKDIEWKWKCTCKEVKSRAEVNILVLKVCQCEEKLPIQSKISDFQNWAPSGRSRQKTKSND